MKKIAIILSGGNGHRINSDIPKQFITINNKLILFYSLETFYNCKEIDNIIIACHPNYVEPLKQLLKHNKMDDKVYVVLGGKSRNKSLAKAVKFIEINLNVSEHDLILSHDAVRIFVSEKIILENISLLKNKAADVIYTAIKSADTIGFNNPDKIVFNIPNRDLCFKGQTPQSATWKTFKEVYDTKFDQEIFDNSDFCKLAELINKKIMICEGSDINFKITTDFDLMIAKKIINGN